LSGGLERFLLGVAERVLRVPPNMSAGQRHAARQFGKFDRIDALVAARVALRERLQPASLPDRERMEIKLLVDQREHLLGQAQRIQLRLRWLLHDLDPDLQPASRTLGLRGRPQPSGQATGEPAEDYGRADLPRACQRHPSPDAALPAARGRAAPVGQGLCAGAPAGVWCGHAGRGVADRRDRRHPPLPDRRPARDLLRRRALGRELGAPTGPPPQPRRQPQLNRALQLIALTQIRAPHAPAREYLARRIAEGKTKTEAIRALKRHVARHIHRILTTNTQRRAPTPLPVGTAPMRCVS
jgi:transposase